ncbi:MAG: cytochrome c [Actinomycetota bacterium]|nr:cytochrome c [Actinomycetota bacterium]
MLLGITTAGKIGLGAVAGLFIVFALLSSFYFPRRDPNFPGNRLGLFVGVTALLFLATIGAVVVFAKESEESDGAEAAETQTNEEPATTGEEPEPEGEAPAGDAAAGEAVYTSAGCGGCHALEAAGSSGAVGPNLDESQPDADLVEERVRNGSGAMPAFEGQLDDTQIENVTAFVVASTQG